MNKQNMKAFLAVLTMTGALSASAGQGAQNFSEQDITNTFFETAQQSADVVQEQKIASVPVLSQENVVAYNKQFESHVKSVNTARVAAYSAGLAGIGYFTYRWLRNNAKDPVLKEDYDKLQKKTTELEAQVKLLAGVKAAAAPTLTWGAWAASGVSSLKDYALGITPDFFKAMVLSQVSGLVIGSMPHIGASLTFNPSLKWALEEHTDYVEVLQTYMNWYQRVALIAQDTDQFYFLWRDMKKEYALCTQQLVKETEKLLGYMIYIHNTVKPDNLVLRARVEVTIDSIVLDTNNLITLINSFLEVDNKEVTVDMLAELLKEWQTRVFTILGHLENFEVVTHSLGFVELDQRTGKALRGQCTDLKRWIVPQFQGHPPRSEQPRALTDPEQLGQTLISHGMGEFLS